MKKFLVIGNPIEHSLSPKLHNYWIKKNNLNAVYEKQKLNENEIKDLILDVKKGKLNGINVTVPFKQTVIPFLDKLSTESEKTNSVNTIYLEGGKTIGHNTDIEGFKLGIKSSKINIQEKKILILGAGGVTSSIVLALKKMKASKIMISNRTKSRIINLTKLFDDLEIIEWGKIPMFDVIINATSVGLKDDDRLELDFSNTDNNKIFYDLIYNPQETNFLKIGKSLGNQTENGKLMFIYQALMAFEIWHGIRPEVNSDVIKLLEK